MNDVAFIVDVLKLMADNDHRSDLLWGVDSNGTVRFSVICSDVFWWATADAEDVTPDNLPLLKQAFVDAKAVHEFGDIYAGMLFASRIRGMRPQGASYPEYSELWPLFDACGPKREVELGNPKKHPADYVGATV